MSKDTGGPAFSRTATEQDYGTEGMTLRQYAAIHLRVPDSGTDWLDAMIRQSYDVGKVKTQMLSGESPDIIHVDGYGDCEITLGPGFKKV